MGYRVLLSLLVLILAPLLTVFPEEVGTGRSEEEKTLEMEVGLTGTYPAVQGSDARFSKYGDMKDDTVGAYGSVYLRYADPTGTFVKFNMLDPGYDTQYYRLDGGKWGRYRYFLYYNEIPHNLTYNALTPYAGAGSDTLGYPGGSAPGADPTAWNAFDYQTKRKDYGAGIKVDRLKPFFFEVSASQEKKTGTKPSGAEGARAFGNVIELPGPVDYTTNHVKAEAGYAKEPYFLSLHYLYSGFNNSDSNLNFRNPFLSAQPNTDYLPLEPDNSFHKARFTGTAMLPARSRFNVNLGYSAARSSKDLLASIWDGNALLPLALSSNRFHGDVRTTNYDFVLVSNPVRFVSGKAHYKYYKRDNQSDVITAVENGMTTSNANSLYSYNKQTYGADLDFRIRRDLHLLAGYRHVDLDRSRDDIYRTRDDVYSAEARWSPLQIGMLKVGYEKLIRVGNHQVTDLTTDPVEIWVRTFDAASKDMETFKATLALAPLDVLSFNVGCKYRRSSYTETTLGLLRDETKGFNIDADYTIGKFARVFGYFDYDIVTSTQFQRNFVTAADPYGTLQNATNFNWESDQKDKTFDLGVALDLYVIPEKLTVRLSGDYLRAHGTNDFTYFTSTALTEGRTNDNIDIGNWDSYRQEFYMIKFLYRYTASTLFTFGYAYDKYTFSDAQYNEYVYTLGSPANIYLTGAYANPDYKANVVFFGVVHRF